MPKFVNTLRQALLGSDPTADEGTLYYNSTTDEMKIKGASAWSTLGSSTTTEMPTGSVITWTGSPSAPPSGWLLCDGSARSRSTYSSLFAITSTYFGAGDGSTTFNLPDFRELSLVGAISANLGVAVGNTAGGISWANGSTDPFAALTHTSDNASHTHTFSDNEAGAHSHAINHTTTAAYSSQTASGDHTHTYTGSCSSDGHAHSIGNTTAVSATVSMSVTSPNLSVASSTHTHGFLNTVTGNSHSHTITESVSSNSAHTHTYSATVPSFTATSGIVPSHTHGGTMASDATAAHIHDPHSANRARVWYLVKS